MSAENTGLDQEILDAQLMEDPTKALEEVVVEPPKEEIFDGYDFTLEKNKLKAGNQYHFVQSFISGDLTIYINIDVKVYESVVNTIISQVGSDKRKYNGKVMKNPKELELYGAPRTEKVKVKSPEGEETEVEVVKYFVRTHNSMEDFIKWAGVMKEYNQMGLKRTQVWADKVDKNGKPVLDSAGNKIKVKLWSKPITNKEPVKEEKEQLSSKPKGQEPAKPEAKKEVNEPTGRVRKRGKKTIINKFYISGGVANFNFK